MAHKGLPNNSDVAKLHALANRLFNLHTTLLAQIQMQTLFFYNRVEHWSDTNSKRRTRPIVNPQHRLLAIGTKEFPMDHLLLKKSDNTYLFCARASACALAGVLPFTLPLTFACAFACALAFALAGAPPFALALTFTCALPRGAAPEDGIRCGNAS